MSQELAFALPAPCPVAMNHNLGIITEFLFPVPLCNSSFSFFAGNSWKASGSSFCSSLPPPHAQESATCLLGASCSVSGSLMAANAERTMIPLHSLLNPVPPKRKIIQSHHVSPTTIPTSASSATTWIAPSRAKMDRLATQSRGGGGGIGIGNTSGLVKSKTQGLIRFAPFENVDEKSYRELSRFQVDLFGQIHEYCEHIPYNSSKKDFFEKTGRESIEGKRLCMRLIHGLNGGY